jgi:hypothetical protein
MNYRDLAPIALMLQLPLLTSCNHSPRERLQGRWVGEGVENFASSQIARATGWAKGTSFEFRGNRVTVSVPAESPRQGTFVVAQELPNELRVSFVRPQGARDEALFQLDGDGLMRWKIDGSRSVLLRKVQD